MKLSIIRRFAKVVKVLMLMFVLFNFVTPVFAAIDGDMKNFVDQALLVMKILAALFVGWAGICCLNGNSMYIRPAILGLILIFGADLIVDFFDGIFGN